jgi:hypothetical protein
MAQEQHTKGPLEVRLEGTCTSAWAEIGYWCGSGEDRQWRMLAQTDTTHVERTDVRGRPIKGDVGDIHELPARFVSTPDGAELIANARLWSRAAKVLETLKMCELALTLASHPECCTTVDPATALLTARTVIAEATAA